MMLNGLFLNLEALDSLDDRGRGNLERLISQVRSYPAHATIVRANKPQTESKLLLEGYVCRCKDLASGERQIVI